jgi:PBP1b-binding outer membrane lipoprotein LpoB
MKIRTSIVAILSEPRRSTKSGSLIILLIIFLTGCSSVITNSEEFYKDMPRRRINWREYLTD